MGLLLSISQDEHERAVFRSRRMYQTDLASNLATAEARGRAEGKLEITRKMKELGIPIEQIVQATGLSEQQIQEL